MAAAFVVLLIILAIGLCAFAVPALVWWVYNGLVADAIGWGHIGFWPIFGIVLLFGLLTGGLRAKFGD